MEQILNRMFVKKLLGFNYKILKSMDKVNFSTISNKSCILKNISPVDGRYANEVKDLRHYFSEFALMKYRVFVELKWF